MIYDMKQPAKNWLAAHIDNFGVLLDNGSDPSCIITIGGIELEIRLNKLPGVFERETISLTKAEGAEG